MSLVSRTPQRSREALGALLHSRLGRALTAPHGPDRYLELLDPLAVRGECRARVVARRMETADVATLTLRPGAGWRAHRPGQHVVVGVERAGVRRSRCFSVSSVPDAGAVELTVKAHPDGDISRQLVFGDVQGRVVSLSEASGEFMLPTPRPRQLLLVSGGSGITPVMSMLRTLCAEGHDGDVVFLHYARTAQDAIFGDELKALDAAHPNLRVVPVLTRDGAPDAALAGHFQPSHLAALGIDPAAYVTFACGPAALIDAVQSHWAQSDAGSRLAVEYFQPPRRADAGESGGRVTFADSGVDADDGGASLLETAEAAGLSPDYGCRMGICHTCACRKTSGTVRDLVTGRLSGDGDESIRPCVSAPVGDVTLAL